MDVVFNHTAEGNENGPLLSFRGVDNSVYYMLAPKVFFLKFTIFFFFWMNEIYSLYALLCKNNENFWRMLVIFTAPP